MTVDPKNENLTGLLQAWSNGDRSALEELTPLVYAELHNLARRQMLRERDGHLLQPSALVNEAVVRLMGNQSPAWQNRAQFYAVSARMMRQILVEFARAQATEKRGARQQHVALSSTDVANPEKAVSHEDLVAVDQALRRLAELDARQAQVVELRFFGGLDNGQIAEVLEISEQTVLRDWRSARAWLVGIMSAG